MTSDSENTEPVIREARSDADYHKAYPIVRQLFPQLDMQTYAQRVFVARATGYRMFVAEVDDEIVGVLGIISSYNLHDGFVTYIEHVVVDEDARGGGYGSLLLKFAEQRAVEEGCKLIDLDTDFGNTDAERLYEKNGYVRYGSCYEKKIGRSDN